MNLIKRVFLFYSSFLSLKWSKVINKESRFKSIRSIFIQLAYLLYWFQEGELSIIFKILDSILKFLNILHLESLVFQDLIDACSTLWRYGGYVISAISIALSTGSGLDLTGSSDGFQTWTGTFHLYAKTVYLFLPGNMNNLKDIFIGC